MLLCGCSRFPFPLETCMYGLLRIIRAVSILVFFGVAQAFKRRFCSGIYASFWCFCFQLCSVLGNQICYKEAIMLAKYATLWLFTLPFSPCNLYVLFTSHFRLIYSLLRACINDVPKIKLGKSKIINQSLIFFKTLRAIKAVVNTVGGLLASRRVFCCYYSFFFVPSRQTQTKAPL